MASLWSVSDHSTRLLMARFYQRLKQGAPLVSALHQAQRAGARGELGAAYAHPFYWAPFGLHGRGDGS
jgi:CHAT domain-containing protein